jgi:hypothetical protein
LTRERQVQLLKYLGAGAVAGRDLKLLLDRHQMTMRDLLLDRDRELLADMESLVHKTLRGIGLGIQMLEDELDDGKAISEPNQREELTMIRTS